MWGYHFNGCFHAGKFEVSRYSNEELRGNGKVCGKMHHVLRKTKGNGYIQSLRAFLYYVKIKTGVGVRQECLLGRQRDCGESIANSVLALLIQTE